MSVKISYGQKVQGFHLWDLDYIQQHVQKNSGALNSPLTIGYIAFTPSNEGDRSVNLRISFIYCE
jgi:hypothetical protein